MKVFKYLTYGENKNNRILSKFIIILELLPKLHSSIGTEIIMFYFLFGKLSILKSIPENKRFSYIISLAIKNANKYKINTESLVRAQYFYAHYKKLSEQDSLKYIPNAKEPARELRKLVTVESYTSKVDAYKGMMHSATYELLQELISKRKFLLLNY